VKSAIARAVGRCVTRSPRLATRVMRLPSVLPGRARARLYRSLSWPLAVKLGTQTEVTVSGGSRMLVRTDDLIGRVLAVSGEWEPNVTAALRHALEPGDVFLDIGAHIGYYTLFAARMVGPGGRVYAFEPAPANYRALQANIELNGLRNVTALELAVGETPGRATLYEGPGDNSGMATLNPMLAAKSTPPVAQLDVDVRPVASVVPEEDLARVRAIKIDVEWQEVEVLRALGPIFELELPVSVFVEWTPRRVEPGAGAELRHLCESHGLTIYRLRSGYSLERLFPERVDAPAPVADIPAEQTDLLLRR
jgi:FkbM family methyltransferase